jgi:protein-S-isoprenylcysteine O-methyltransferase Ste14
MTHNLIPPILIILIYLPIILFAIISKQFKQKFMKVHSTNKKEYTIEATVGTIYFLIIITSLYTTIPTNQIQIATGISIYLVSLIITYTGYLAFQNTKPNQLTQKWPYSFSRNPTYFFGLTAILGIAILTMSTILLLLVIIQFILTHQIILTEEKDLAKKYKTQYKTYMKKVGRYF